MVTKERIKGFILGTVSTSLLVSTVAFADPVKKQVEVVYNNIKVVVDGNTVNPVDSEGNKVEPFIYEGTTYLPVRGIGQAFGKEVSWDGTSNTVYVGKNPNGTELTSIPYARTDSNSFIEIDKWKTNSWDKVSGNFSIANKQYSKGLGVHDDYIGTDRAYIVYNLNSEYKELTGLFGIDDDDKNNGKGQMVLVITGDGKELYRSPQVKPGDNPKDVKVNVSGVNQLTIAFDSEGTTGGYGILANPLLK